MAIDFSGAQFGMIQQLKTGNPMVDMALCMLIPGFFAWIFSTWDSHILPFLRDLRKMWGDGEEGRFSREIEFEQMRNSWGSVLTGGDEKNNVLQKAITLYLSKRGLSYKHAGTSLMNIKNKRNRYDDSDDEDEDGGRGGAGGLKKYTLTTVAPQDKWVEVAPNVEFRQSQLEEDGEEGKKVSKKKITFTFRSFHADGEKMIDDFVKECWQYYIDELDRMKDKGRYMYNLVSKPEFSASKEDGDDGDSNDARKFKRYKLSDEKTFNSLFFPQKETILNLLNHFKNKTGKYRIAGYPHKLGLLLHGPPGTGKTSLIKALAHETNRSIVNIPLARIKTNQELTDLMYDLRYSVPGEDVPIKLRYKDIIFVMEDIDAASKIVHQRGGPKKIQVVQEQVTNEGVSTTTVSEEPAGLPEAQSEDVPQGPMMPGGDGGEMLEVLAAMTMGGDDKSKNSSSLFSSRLDKLDLSGLLNVLDGVVDTPQRILVMTTNHPEKLDAALIRPGRVDKKLFLGYLAGESAISMLQHYFPEQKINEDQKGLVTELLHENNLTPAQVEQLCAENDTVADMVKALWHRCQPLEPVQGLSRAASVAMQ